MQEEAEFELDYDSIEAETAKAYLIVACNEDLWIPKSQIISINEREKKIIIPEWLAIEKELV